MNIKNLFKDIKKKKITMQFAFVDKDTLGLYVTLPNDNRMLLINTDLFIVDTFLHELCHHNHPTYSEKKVCKLTARKIERLSIKEIIKISKMVTKYAK